MNNNDTSQVVLSINNDVVRETVKARIAEALSQELGGLEEIVNKMIKLAIETKVSKDGTVSNYSGDNKYSFMDAIVLQQIKDITKELVIEYFSEHRAELKKELSRQLSLKKTQSDLVNALLAGITDTISCEYRHKVEVVVGRNC